jgi:hypothetical protein
MKIMMNFKKSIYVVAGMTLASIFTAPVFAAKGNGLPDGPMNGSFHLQVIAFDTCPAGDLTESNRHMIAVMADYGMIDSDTGTTSTQHGNLKNTLVKDNTIALTSSGVDGGFWVEDGNACANRGPDGAKLWLPITPANCDDGSGNCTLEDPTFTQYEVYVRLVGKPNSKIGVTTCAEEPDLIDVNGNLIADQVLCSTENVIKVRESGGGKAPKFDNVSAELLTICLDTFDDGNFDGNCDVRYPLFDTTLENYFWQWNTHGRPHAQLVFVPVP